MRSDRRGGGKRAPRPPVGAVLPRAVGFTILWVVLTEGERYAWGIAALSILAAAWVSVRLLPPAGRRLSFGGIARFIPYFLERSLRGGLDVAGRAFRSPPAVNPGILEFAFELPDGPSRLFFTAVVGLVPGTLGTATVGDSLLVHVIDQDADNTRQLRALEHRVAAIFGEKTDPHDPSIPSTAERGAPPT